MTRRITRRQALGELLAGTALVAAGCGTSAGLRPDPHGSTLRTTYKDRLGTGMLTAAPGEPLLALSELGPQARTLGVLATLAHVTDAHVLDAQSPARVTFLDRLGAPFQSTFRPHETLSAQVLAGALHAIRALAPDAVIQGGDLIDNDQGNELELALAVLAGGTARPGSGGGGYVGVQSPGNADPFYYRPDLDAPRHPGLLQAATRPFASPGASRTCYSVLGDHDILVAGEIAPTAQTRALALGDQALWELPPGLTVPPGLVTRRSVSAGAGYSPDGPPSPQLVDRFLAQALRGPKVRVPSDRARRELDHAEMVARLSAASRLSPSGSGADGGRVDGPGVSGPGVSGAGAGGAGADGTGAGGTRLNYRADLGSRVRLLVLDLARRNGGSGGLVHPGQPDWLAGELGAAGERWVLVVSHQPLAASEGGEQMLALLDGNPRVIAAISGHTHRNRIRARRTRAGGYWLISTASLIDYPQQARALRVLATAGGGVAIQTWMLDHVLPGELGTVSRRLAYLDAQGGRPEGLTGERLDRNVTLYRA
ncbi:MAG: metallophosphoesterase family protein [Solirubrobacteraceae bacterium]